MVASYLPLSWHTYQTLAQLLAAGIISHKEPIDEIIAISRGGLTLGHLLSDLLRIPISIINIQSYTDIRKQGEVIITGRLQSSIKGKRIVVVDDVADSGKTFKRAIAYLKRCHPASITTATLFYKPHSVYRPDYFAKITSKWILFPYEMTEMIMLITKKMVGEGKSKRDIQRFLEKINFSDEQIAFVREYHLNNK